jgi:hypothetical protein
MLNDLGERAAPVAERVFHFLRKFAEGASVALWNKERVVSKTAPAAFLANQGSLDGT